MLLVFRLFLFLPPGSGKCLVAALPVIDNTAVTSKNAEFGMDGFGTRGCRGVYAAGNRLCA